MLNAFLDVWSKACYTQGNAEQDHDFDSDCYRAGGGSHGISCAIVHPRQRAKSEGLSTPLLCQYDVLCHVAKEYRSVVGVTRKEWFGIGDNHDLRAHGVCRFAASIHGRSVRNQN